MSQAVTTQRAHELIDRIATSQISAVVHLLEVMLDPVNRSIADAPWDDEPVSEEEHRKIAAARASFSRGESVYHEEILAEHGLTMEDFERMGRTPLEAN